MLVRLGSLGDSVHQHEAGHSSFSCTLYTQPQLFSSSPCILHEGSHERIVRHLVQGIALADRKRKPMMLHSEPCIYLIQYCQSMMIITMTKIVGNRRDVFSDESQYRMQNEFKSLPAAVETDQSFVKKMQTLSNQGSILLRRVIAPSREWVTG